MRPPPLAEPIDTERWQAARRILAVRLDGMGDVLMTTPALRALAAEGREVTLLASGAGAEAAELVPSLASVTRYAAPWMKPGRTQHPDVDHALICELRECRFDAAVIFTVFSQSPLPAALMAFLAGIPLRAAHCRENPYHLLTTWLPEPEPDHGIRHEVLRQLALVDALGFAAEPGPLSLAVPAEDEGHARRLLAPRQLDPGTWFAVHPGASAPSRRYPAESFTAAARMVAVRTGLRPVILGGAGEQELGDVIATEAGLGAVSLAGQLGLGALAAVIREAPVMITNNSGPAHVAAAMGTPVVVLYALTNPQHTPWQVPSRVLFRDVPCRSCFRSVCPEGHHRCLRGVLPAEVAGAAIDLLHETGWRAPGPAVRASLSGGHAGAATRGVAAKSVRVPDGNH